MHEKHSVHNLGAWLATRQWAIVFNWRNLGKQESALCVSFLGCHTRLRRIPSRRQRHKTTSNGWTAEFGGWLVRSSLSSVVFSFTVRCCSSVLPPLAASDVVVLSLFIVILWSDGAGEEGVTENKNISVTLTRTRHRCWLPSPLVHRVDSKNSVWSFHPSIANIAPLLSESPARAAESLRSPCVSLLVSREQRKMRCCCLRG